MVFITVVYKDAKYVLPDVPYSATFKTLKENMSERVGVSRQFLRFLFKGRVIDDDQVTMFDAELQENSVIQLVIKLPLIPAQAQQAPQKSGNSVPLLSATLKDKLSAEKLPCMQKETKKRATP